MKKVKYPRLNLGCGFDYIYGFENIDKQAKKVDLRLDLECAKLPYKNNSIEIIKASHILEHIQNYILLMREIHRILIPGGVLYIRVPDRECDAAYADPTHVRFFTPASFYLWTQERPAGADTDNIGGLFTLEFIEIIKHNSGSVDRGLPGRWFTEIEVELIKVGQ